MTSTFNVGDMVYQGKYYGIVVDVKDGKAAGTLENFWIKVWWNTGLTNEYPSLLLKSHYSLSRL